MSSGWSVGAERRPGAAYVENCGEKGVGRFGFAHEVVGACVKGASRGFGAAAEDDDGDVWATGMEPAQESLAAAVSARAGQLPVEEQQIRRDGFDDGNQDVGLGGFTDDLDVRLLFQKETHSGTQPGLIVRQ